MRKLLAFKMKYQNQLILCINAALIFLVVFSIASIFSRLSVDTHHDGIMFKPALDVANGKMLFVDTFTQYGALTTLIQAWAIQIFGPYVVVIKIATAFFYACEAVLLWVIWRFIMPNWLANISIILWASLLPFYVAIAFPWSTVYATVFQLASILAIIKFIHSKSEFYLFIAGVCAALVFWCRQPAGVIHLMSIIVFSGLLITSNTNLIRGAIRKTFIFLLGWILTTSLFIIWIVVNEAFHDFWLQSIKFSLLFNEAFGPKSFFEFLIIFFPYPYSNWNPGYIWNLLPLSCIILFVVSIYRIFIKNIALHNINLLLLVICSLASWHIYYPFPDFMKASWGSSLMVGLFTYLIYLIIPIKKYYNKNYLTVLILFFIYTPYIYSKVPMAINYYKTTNVTVQYPNILRGLLLSQQQANNLTEIYTYINQYLLINKNAFFINVTTDALYATFTDRSINFHPAYVKWTLLQYIIYPSYQKALLDYVQKFKPLILIYIPPNINPIGLKDGAPFVFNGEETFLSYAILRRFNGGASLIAPYSCKDTINKTANFHAEDEQYIKNLCITVQPDKK